MNYWWLIIWKLAGPEFGEIAYPNPCQSPNTWRNSCPCPPNSGLDKLSKRLAYEFKNWKKYSKKCIFSWIDDIFQKLFNPSLSSCSWLWPNAATFAKSNDDHPNITKMNGHMRSGRYDGVNTALSITRQRHLNCRNSFSLILNQNRLPVGNAK